MGPAAKRGGIRHTIRVLECRRGFFPGTMPHKAPPQCLTARQQAVVRVRQRKQWEKCECLSTPRAATTPDADPIVMLIVRLLAAAPMADDRIAFTNWASPQHGIGAARCPIGLEQLVRGDGKWDKQNRTSLGLCPSGVDPPRSRPEAELLPSEPKSNWKRIQLRLWAF